ncbi:DUF1929-domain-containing protein [Mycena albidolilacea]|uniref:DUF1929-domain-containing protein n=1 Tax=Mycena albidolilacea TaxID=1033008 RepID=A0AAD6ZY35_9AGAR|nr:DUF1929-domain-containing protein [Mycena albidolilacea]
MTPSPLSLLALGLATLSQPVLGSLAGSFADGGNTQISAMMMFVGNNEKVYILDKAEGNEAQINGHPAWGSVWDINTHQATVMDVATNVFCASGMHLPNGSFVTFGGNGAIGPGGNIGSVRNPGGGSGSWDAVYQDFDGSRSIRILNPCTSSDDMTSAECQWFDNPAVLSMKKQRWYSAAEMLGDGTIVIIGGFVNGGYINRNTPNNDPTTSGGAAEPTFEFFPSTGQEPQQMAFLTKTSGLNAYAHTYLMASGQVFVQANYSTMLWDPRSNQETDLPDMPGQVIRVYPASGGVAMLPLTVANNYTQTLLFCGGTDMPEPLWGNYSYPNTDTWNYPASKDCQRITPEPADGSPAAYEQDDDMIEGRTMGQFIILPTGQLFMVNGGLNGTAGYADSTGTTPLGQMPFGQSLASGPVGTPAIYDPTAPKGSRWSNAGLATSQIPRLYHSSALLLPDATVLIAGSNPNVDVNLTRPFKTEYRAEVFYPPYFAASTRPVPSGIPSKLTYGGNAFDITIPASSYSGKSDDAADNTTVALLRPGWTTHGMNMGQRYLQLQNTYTVSSNGDLTLHVAQLPPNPNLFQPGPAWLYVVVNGIPSNGTSVLVGSGAVGTQPLAAAVALPPSVKLASASGSANAATTKSDPAATTDKKTSSSSNMTIIIAAAAGGAVLLALIGGLIWFCAAKRKREATRTPASKPYGMSGPTGASVGLGAAGALRNSDSSAFTPLHHDGPSQTWNASSASLGGYQDEPSHERDQSFGSGYSQQQSNYPQYGHVQQGSQGSYDQQQYGHAQQGSYDQYDQAPGGYGQAGGYAQPRAPYGDNMSTRGSTNGMSMDFDPYTAEAMRTTPVRRF